MSSRTSSRQLPFVVPLPSRRLNQHRYVRVPSREKKAIIEDIFVSPLGV